MRIDHGLLFALLVILLLAERLGELRSANRNTRRLIAMGGREFGAAHYRIIVAMHTAFFIILGTEFIFRGKPLLPLWPIPFGIFVAAQSLRFFTRRAMGNRWTTRIVIVPGERLVTTGPFRFLRHPIYVAVALEIFSVPLIFGLYVTCVVFSVLNAIMLIFIRIPAEEVALDVIAIETDLL